ncbi:MAG TPA: hypothetical protein VII08_16640 [Myxococcales bacterium]
MCIDRGAQILDEQVRVRSGRDAHVAVPHEPLHTVHVDALAQQLRCERVPQVVEAHLQRQRLRPEQPATHVLRGLAGAVRALHAGGAVTLLAVLVSLLVAAPAATVLPALRDAGARERIAENLLRISLARPLGSVGSGEEQGTRRVLHLVLDPRPQRCGERQDRRSATFRRIAIVRSGDRDGAAVEIDIALCDREKLSLTQPERRAAGEERPPVVRDLFEHARELLRVQCDVDPPGYLTGLRGGHRIFAHPTACAPGPVEDGVQDRAQLVDTAGRRAVALEVRQEVFHIGAAHARQGQRRDRRREHMLAEAALLDLPARLRAPLVEPPTTERAKAAGQVVLNGNQPRGLAQPGAARGVLFELQLGREGLGLRAAFRLCRSLGPAVNAAPAHVPGLAALEDARHDQRSPFRLPAIAGTSPRANAWRSAGTNLTPQPSPFARGSSPRSAAL